MKIALLTDGIPPYVLGGMQTHSALLGKTLVKKGNSVDLPNSQRFNKRICKIKKK